jgi:ribose transport system substrate-binding protein
MARVRTVRRCGRRIIVGLAFLLSTNGIGAQEATPLPTSIPDLFARDYGPVAAREAYRLALLVPFPEDPFWQAVQRAVEERAPTDGVTVDVYPLSEPSAPEQVAQIEAAVAAGYDGLLLGPVDPMGAVPGIAVANAAGVPVVAIDAAPAGGEVVAVVQTDDVAAARLAGAFIAEAIGGVGRVVNLQGDLASPVALERDRGFREAFAAFPSITLVSELANGSRQVAAARMQGLLPGVGTAVPDDGLPAAVFAANDQMALGAIDAVDAVQADEVLVVGFGVTTDTRTEVHFGRLTATVAEFPQRAGAIAVDLMVRHLNGEAVPEQVDSGSALVTRDNIGQIPL